MSEADSTRQMNLYRNLALALSFLALVGWGTAYFARASAAVQHQLREEVAQLKASQDQLLAERDEAKAQVAAAQQGLTGLQKRLEEAQEKASVTGSVPAPTPSSKPARPSEGQKQKSVSTEPRLPP
jgi:cell division protein FtsB